MADMYARSFPAAEGFTVTQGHADYCKAHGHATHTVNGAVGPFCPRCGENLPSTEAPAAHLPGFIGTTPNAGVQYFRAENIARAWCGADYYPAMIPTGADIVTWMPPAPRA